MKAQKRATKAVVAPPQQNTSSSRSAPFCHNVDIEKVFLTFALRSGIWLNLHHCLYGQARRLLRQAQQEHHPDELSTKTLPQTHGDAWAQAVNYYLENLAVHDLLRSPEMRLLKWSLAELPDAQQPSLEMVPKGLAAQLIASRSVYEQTWWEQQQRMNVSYINTVQTFTARYGPPLAQRISRAFQTSWPTETLLVDIVYWARWSGAYTTLKPNHLVISSSALGNQELAALEVLFHEASHTPHPLRTWLGYGLGNGRAAMCPTSTRRAA